MKSLFNKYEAYTSDGSVLDNIIYRTLKPIFIEWIEKGFSTRDIENIINDNVGSLSAERRIMKAFQLRREERNDIS